MFDISGNDFDIKPLAGVQEFLLFLWLAVVVHHFIIVVAARHVSIGGSHCMVHLVIVIN
jgi:hypothetical protein